MPMPKRLDGDSTTSTILENTEPRRTTDNRKGRNDASAGAACDGPACPFVHGRHRNRGDLFCSCPRHRLLLKGLRENRRGFLSGRARNDGLGRWVGVRIRQSGVTGTARLGGKRLPVRHHGCPLVLGRSNSREGGPW